MKDINGCEIEQGDLVNIFYTSSDKEHIHDCVYKASIGIMGDLQFNFVDLLWLDHGYNQLPINQTLSMEDGTLSYRYVDKKAVLIIPDTYGENNILRRKWKQLDESKFFQIIKKAVNK